MSKLEIVGLVVAVAIAIALALPSLKHTYTWAVLSGQSAEPPPIPAGVSVPFTPVAPK